MKLKRFYDGKKLQYVNVDEYGNEYADFEIEIMKTGKWSANNHYIEYNGITFHSQGQWNRYKKDAEITRKYHERFGYPDDHKNGGR